MKVYVSIPYTGHEADFPARCDKAHERHDKSGDTIITPRDVIKDSSTPYEICMGKCIETLLGCKKAIFADGWADSKGCTLEMNVCQIYGIEWKVDVGI